MKRIKFEYRFLIFYLILGGLWIVFSDAILGKIVSDVAVLTRLQTYKGWFYVVVTAFLFFFLLRRHLSKLRKAEFEARESDRLKTAFLQNISHEIRTPLNGIVGFTQLLNSEDLSDSHRKEYTSVITKSSDRLLSIINDVIEISLIESGKIKERPEIFNLNELMNEHFEIFNSQIKTGIDFRLTNGLQNEESLISGDRVKISQVIYNLLSNASKFTEKGTIHFGYSVKNNKLGFFVSDSGIGIDPSLHTAIFERFSKEDRNSNRIYDGVGLGLAICKGNLGIMGGEIWVESEPGKGSTFYFNIPYRKANAGVRKTNPEDTDLMGKKEVKVLVVEDDETNFEFVKAVLSSKNFQLIHAWNGTEGISLFEQKKPDIVILDLKMPGINGYDVLKSIRQLNPKIPVIAQTALVMSNDREKALKSGFNDFIAKPYKKNELLLAIKSIVEKI